MKVEHQYMFFLNLYFFQKMPFSDVPSQSKTARYEKNDITF